MTDAKYKIQNLEQRKSLVGGGSLIDIMHVDYQMDNGMVGFVDVPLAQATKQGVDAAIQAKIATVVDILTAGK